MMALITASRLKPTTGILIQKAVVFTVFFDENLAEIC